VQADLLTNITNALAASSGGKATAAMLQSPGVGLGAALTSFLSTQPAATNTPKAYLAWILFDEQFNVVHSSAQQVGASGATTPHVVNGQSISKNGYLYVYVSNEATNVDVFFDNLQVTHIQGALMEETHYYPFGLVMAGMSSKAANITPNKEKTFQEQRFDDDLGVNYIQFKYRSHDPQIGRFIQIDPLADDYRYNSTYAFSENRVTDGRELEGLEYVSIHHYSDGTIGTKTHYKSTDKEINKINGTTSGVYNSASYGPQGKGVVHYYYDNKGSVSRTEWDQKQEGGQSDFAYHGLYSGPGSVTKDGGKGSTNYDFSFQPIDWSDAIAKRHDMDYAAATATGEKYAGFLEDVRTVQADRDMVQRINDYTNPFKKVEGVETPFRTSWSGEMDMSMEGQLVVIGALATYKQWKIDNGYGNKDTYETLRKDFYKHDALTAAIIDLINPNKK
jgi:RHS repeat-associated protein